MIVKESKKEEPGKEELISPLEAALLLNQNPWEFHNYAVEHLTPVMRNDELFYRRSDVESNGVTGDAVPVVAEPVGSVEDIVSAEPAPLPPPVGKTKELPKIKLSWPITEPLPFADPFPVATSEIDDTPYWTENKEKGLPAHHIFFLDYVRKHRKDEQSGVYTRKFHKEYELHFPSKDPVAERKILEEQGFLISHPTRGGFVFYERTRKTEAKVTSNGRKQKPKDSYVSPNKSVWRDTEIEFIRSHRICDKDTNTFFMAGPEALEIPGFDSLDILRGNVYTAERNRKVVDAIEALDLGIHVAHDTVVDFLKATDKQFSVALFDYDGALNTDKMEALEVMIRRGLLNERAILGVNLFGNRENPEIVELYEQVCNDRLDLPSFREAGLVASDNIHDQVTGKRTKHALRNYGITGVHLRLFFGYDAVQVNSQMLNKLPKDQRQAYMTQLARSPPKTSSEILQFNETIRPNLMETLQHGGPAQEDGRAANRTDLANLAIILGAVTSRPYFVDRAVRVMYDSSPESNSSNLFYSDFYALNQHREIFSGALTGPLEQFLTTDQKAENFVRSYDKSPERMQREMNMAINHVISALKVPYSTLFMAEHTVPYRGWVGTPGGKAPTKTEMRDIRDRIACGETDRAILNMYPGAHHSLRNIRKN